MVDRILPRLIIALMLAIAVTFWHAPFTLLAALAFILIAIGRDKTLAPLATFMGVLPFAVFLCLPLVLSGNLPQAGVTLLRLSVSSLALAWSLHDATEWAVLQSLRAIRVPALLVSVIGMILRYLHVLREETNRMQIAQLSRLGHSATRMEAWQRAVSLLGILLSRSAVRSERIHTAMLSRGYGRIDTAPSPWQMPALGWFSVSLAGCLVLVLTVVDRLCMSNR